jgi:hypothetical protein
LRGALLATPAFNPSLDLAVLCVLTAGLFGLGAYLFSKIQL